MELSIEDIMHHTNGVTTIYMVYWAGGYQSPDMAAFKDYKAAMSMFYTWVSEMNDQHSELDHVVTVTKIDLSDPVHIKVSVMHEEWHEDV
jgi:hypothetical protein